MLTDRHDLLAFGAKITRRDGAASVIEHVTVTEPIEGTDALIVHPTRLGGTRHLSAAQFVHDQKESHLRWSRPRTDASPCSPGRRASTWCYAHRVESLLL